MTHGGKFFTYIADELPGKMRAFLPLSERREDTFIAGFSMGGYGAFKIGLARPMQYAAIGCISAGVSNDTPDTVALRELRTGGRPLKDTEEDVPASIARAAALGKDAPAHLSYNRTGGFSSVRRAGNARPAAQLSG